MGVLSHLRPPEALRRKNVESARLDRVSKDYT
jgi:hypothetical protein